MCRQCAARTSQHGRGPGAAFLAFLLMLFGPAVAGAQSVTEWDQGSRALTSGWRTHPGNDSSLAASWAARDFDDSGWALAAPGDSHTPTPGPNDEHWYRLKIDLPAQHPPLALLEFGVLMYSWITRAIGRAPISSS